MIFGAEKGLVGPSSGGGGGGGSSGGCPGARQVPVGLSVIPSPPVVGGMEFGATARSAGSIRRGDLAMGGGHDSGDPRRPRWPGKSRRRCRGGAAQPADGVIAQRVVDQLEQFPRGGDG